MGRSRTAAATIAAVVLVGAGCGADDTGNPVETAAPIVTAPPMAPISSTTTAAVEPTAGTTPGDVYGYGEPAIDEGDVDTSSIRPLAGTLTVDGNGCWTLADEYDTAVFVFPPGTRQTHADGGVTLGTDVVITGGDHVDATGAVIARADLPGGATGRLARYADSCENPAVLLVLATSIDRTYAPDGEQLVELAGEVSAALFTVEHGCGYGFAASDADQRWSLTITPTSAGLPAAGPVELPDPRFEVVIRHGDRLFADHCDDVREAFEPLPVVAAEWPIVTGSFTYPGPSDCTGVTAETDLVGGLVETAAGAVDLEPIALTNASFGCLPG